MASLHIPTFSILENVNCTTMHHTFLDCIVNLERGNSNSHLAVVLGHKWGALTTYEF
uniref:Uncharacterized protein n=1 Tax=Rhizophora mucronata TaxID=61149 RepID=A0A2P2N8Y4_RHIMU